MQAVAVRRFDRRAFLQRFGLLLVLLGLCAIVALFRPRFLTADNLLNILRQATINGIIAVGMMLVILTRGIDLSVGSILAVAAMVTASMLQSGTPALVALIVCIAIGGALGLINGLLVSRLNIPPFIATLGTMTALRGLAQAYSDGQPITGLDEGFRQIGIGMIGPIPSPIILAAAIFFAGYMLLNHTPLGRQIFALGDNERAAFFSGLPTRTITALVYAISGAMAALAGAILMSRLNSAQPILGRGYEFNAIAAVVVGGTSFSGGEGTITGTLIGVLIIEVLNNAINLLNVPSDFQGVVQGGVIALALLLYRLVR